jgi:hypothetical protein
MKYPEALQRVMYYNQQIVERLEHFLSHHLMVCPQGLPQHKLWLNVNVEERATQSLIDIMDSLESLRDVHSELAQLFKSLNEVSGKIDSHTECPDLGYSFLPFRSLRPLLFSFSFAASKLIVDL